jgi:glycosyltransferase 2 family protein
MSRATHSAFMRVNEVELEADRGARRMRNLHARVDVGEGVQQPVGAPPAVDDEHVVLPSVFHPGPDHADHGARVGGSEGARPAGEGADLILGVEDNGVRADATHGRGDLALAGEDDDIDAHGVACGGDLFPVARVVRNEHDAHRPTPIVHGYRSDCGRGPDLAPALGIGLPHPYVGGRPRRLGFTETMVSRERLRRVAALGVRLANERRVRRVAQLLLAAGLVFVAVRLRSLWHDSHIELSRVGWGWLAGSLTVAVGAVLASGFIWLAILRLLGTPTRPSWAGIYLQSQLGKYVPGTLWQYASRGMLAKSCGIPPRVVLRSLPIELASTAFVGTAFSMLLLGWWGLMGALGVVASARASTALFRPWIAFRVGARTTVLYTGTWILIGASFWMAARALVPAVSAAQIPIYTGAFAVAWIVGLVAIYAPGGIGVREAVLVAILGPRIGTADAVLVSTASRVVFTVADLMAAALSVALLHGSAQATPEPVAGR